MRGSAYNERRIDREKESPDQVLQSENLKCLVGQAIAHRGVFDNLTTAENSLDAFARAMSLGFPIELDVHIAKDGTIIVFHDDNLKRMTGMNRPTADCTAKELFSLTLKNTDCRIPSLQETLDFVHNQVPLLIELKYDTPLGQLEEPLLKQLRAYQRSCGGRFAVQSFDPFRMKWFRSHAPDIPRGQLVSNFLGDEINGLKKLALQHMWLNFLSKPQFISANLAILKAPSIAKQREKNRYLFGWTARTLEQFKSAGCACDSVIFDHILPPKTACILTQKDVPYV